MPELNQVLLKYYLETVFRKLRSLDDKILRLALHTEFLGKYRINKRTPRVLL